MTCGAHLIVILVNQQVNLVALAVTPKMKVGIL